MKNNFPQIAVQAAKSIRDARHYALDMQSTDELAAIASVWASDRIPGWTASEFGSWLSSELRPSISELFQQRPEVRALPREWSDEVTEILAQNPWAEGTIHLPSQLILIEVQPDLAEHLQKVAKHGVTYEFLHRLKQEREQKKAVAEMTYGELAHSVNPWVTGDRLQQSKIQDENLFLATFLQREAKPINLNPVGPTQNLTKAGVIAKLNPTHYDVLKKAAVVHAGWLKDELSQVNGEMIRSLEMKRRAESLLAGRRV